MDNINITNHRLKCQLTQYLLSQFFFILSIILNVIYSNQQITKIAEYIWNILNWNL